MLISKSNLDFTFLYDQTLFCKNCKTNLGYVKDRDKGKKELKNNVEYKTMPDIFYPWS